MSQGRKRIWVRVIAAVLILQVVVTGGIYAVASSPERFSAVMKHVPMALVMVFPGILPAYSIARAGDLDVGDEAPLFSLPLEDGSKTVELVEFRGQRPVVLVFGSYT